MPQLLRRLQPLLIVLLLLLILLLRRILLLLRRILLLLAIIILILQLLLKIHLLIMRLQLLHAHMSRKTWQRRVYKRCFEDRLGTSGTVLGPSSPLAHRTSLFAPRSNRHEVKGCRHRLRGESLCTRSEAEEEEKREGQDCLGMYLAGLLRGARAGRGYRP